MPRGNIFESNTQFFTYLFGLGFIFIGGGALYQSYFKPAPEEFTNKTVTVVNNPADTARIDTIVNL